MNWKRFAMGISLDVLVLIAAQVALIFFINISQSALGSVLEGGSLQNLTPASAEVQTAVGSFMLSLTGGTFFLLLTLISTRYLLYKNLTNKKGFWTFTWRTLIWYLISFVVLSHFLSGWYAATSQGLIPSPFALAYGILGMLLWGYYSVVYMAHIFAKRYSTTFRALIHKPKWQPLFVIFLSLVGVFFFNRLLALIPYGSVLGILAFLVWVSWSRITIYNSIK